MILCLQVAKLKSTGKVYALKILNKWKMLKRHQVRSLWCGCVDVCGWVWVCVCVPGEITVVWCVWACVGVCVCVCTR